MPDHTSRSDHVCEVGNMMNAERAKLLAVTLEVGGPFKREGAEGLLSKRRGRPSNNSSPAGSEATVVALVSKVAGP